MRATAALALLLLSGCAAVPMPTEPGAACPIAGSSDWAAWVNAMPGPGPNGQHLIVTGKVTVPTGGYRVSLEPGPVREIHPPVQEVILNVVPPSGAATQAIVEHEVRTSVPALPSYGAVIVRCGRDTVATIENVERAY